MKRFRPRLTYANVASTLALVVALTGGAFAATKLVGSDGQVYGCVTKKGKLTLVKAGKKCGKHKKAIAWSQTGPAGAPGKPGATGPSDIFHDSSFGGKLATSGDTPTTFVSVQLPAGHYMAVGYLELSDAGPDTVVRCYLEDSGHLYIGTSASNAHPTQMTVDVPLSYAKPTTLSLACSHEDTVDPPPEIGYARIWAIKTGHLAGG